MCMICTCEFTLTWRRHHCRACGKVCTTLTTSTQTTPDLMNPVLTTVTRVSDRWCVRHAPPISTTWSIWRTSQHECVTTALPNCRRTVSKQGFHVVVTRCFNAFPFYNLKEEKLCMKISWTEILCHISDTIFDLYRHQIQWKQLEALHDCHHQTISPLFTTTAN